MVRSVTKKYQVWLAGYYDDFNGARAIPDDLNKPSDTSYSVLNSHFGNPLNGEAFLNPRFRFSAEERVSDSAISSGNFASITSGTTANRYLQNDGIFEWLTFDDTRLSHNEWEGRVQLQYPDGHVANRYKFNNDTSDYTVGYQRFINGHNSDASYIVPTGDNDSSYGREENLDYTDANYNNKQAGASTANDHENRFMQRAHLAGVFMGEYLDFSLGTPSSSTVPSSIMEEIHSPAKKPFLVIQSARHRFNDDSPNVPTIIYDGPLNTRLDGDTFTARVALQSMLSTGDWSDVGIKFEVGFASTQAGLLNDTGYTGTPAIDYTLDLDDISYDTKALLGEVTIDNAWIDVDLVFNYTDNNFDVFINGTSHATNIAMNDAAKDGTADGATTASNLYGYQITVTNETGSSGNNGYVSYLMLDRVGLVRYLTDDYTTTDEVQIKTLDIKQATNGFSTCRVAITDDPKLTGGNRGALASDYLLNLKGLFVNDASLDWNILVFADNTGRIDRPIWRGKINNFSIKQTHKRTREIMLDANDSLENLDKQIPLWDIGQKGENTVEDSTDYWSYDAQGFRNAMYLGAGKLKLLDGNVGFDSDSTFRESATQRTQLGSGHPIQMYNNEDTYGPNNIEDDYEGEIIDGFVQKASSTTTVAIMKDATHSITTSAPSGGVNISSTSHNVTGQAPSAVSGTDVEFSSGLTYTPHSSKIVYIGKYPSITDAANLSDYDDTTNDKRRDWAGIISRHPASSDLTSTVATSLMKAYIYFDADPGLKVGDRFYINRRNDNNTVNLTASYNVKHQVSSIKKIRNYFSNTTAGTTYPSVINYLWVVRTNTAYSGSESHGVYTTGAANTDTLLVNGSTSFSWSNDTGLITNSLSTNQTNILNRANHARWMRDLPKSLWFQYHFGIVKEKGKNEPPAYPMTGHTLPLAARLYSALAPSQTISPTSKTVKITQTAYDDAPNYGVAELWSTTTGFGTGPPRSYDNAKQFKEKFVYEGKINVGSDYYLIGCRFITGTYTISGGSFFDDTDGVQNKTLYVKFQDFEDDYKHVWLLWSDMRNNGNADADGSTRKSDFGLQYPISKNYNFDLYFADQVDADGRIDKFASLNAGEDLDVWNIDSTSDPFTGGGLSKPVDYSKPTTSAITLDSNSGSLRITLSGSDTTSNLNYGDYVYLTGTASHDGMHTISSKTSTAITTSTTFVSATQNVSNTAIAYPVTGSEDDFSHYQDWEDKAGALLAIDTAKFFNLNTHINGGKTGQTAGGRTDLTDYVVEERSGFPALIDNYWTEAIASFQTTGSVSREHPNQNILISTATVPTRGFTNGFVGLPILEANDFDDSGIGRLVSTFSQTNNEPNTSVSYFHWDGKLENTVSSSVTSIAGSSTYDGQTVRTITCSGATFSDDGVKAGMTIERTSSSGTVTYLTIFQVVSNTQLTVTDDGSWATSATFDDVSIPTQLAKIFIIDATHLTESTLDDGPNLEQELWDIYYASNPTWTDLGITISLGTTEGEENTPKSQTVHATVYSEFMLRLMMHIDGFYKAKNNGTYWDSDKIRMLWNAAIMDTWLPSARVTSVYDINNVPITSNMTTYNDTSSNDSYGSIVDSRGQTLGATIQKIQEKSGYGTGSTYTTFSYLIGKDNRFEFRPKYNSGLVINRDNANISNIKVNIGGQISNVRVYYSDNSAFVDWPATNLTDSTSWKIVEYPQITSSSEALLVAQQEYNKRSKNPLQVEVTPFLDGALGNKMTEDGRHGYIADPYIALGAASDTVYTLVTNWTRLGTGGVLFPGMVNALNGNMNVSMNDIENRYGTSKNTTSSGNIDWAENYYWYGSNSISHAVQIVHIPNKTPLVSSATSEPMRIHIDLKSGQTGTDIDNAEFTVYLSDYSFGTNRTATLNNQTSVNVKHSGFYEIGFPSNYGAVANAKIVFSFNAEYCRALLRHRCGVVDADILKQVATNTDTIFPLGMREYSEMGGGFRESGTNKRLVWYAPRVHVCRDLSYTPATYVSFTDAGLELNAETMTIKELNWGVKAGETVEHLRLLLERDESLSAGGLISYLFPTNNGHRQRGSNLGGGGGGGYDEGSQQDKPSDNFPDTAPVTPGKPGGSTTDSDGNSYDYSSGIIVSELSKGAYGKLSGRMNLPNDGLSGNSKRSVLGMQNTSHTPSTMRGIEGMDVDIRATKGAATVTADGYSLAGKGLQGGDYSASRESSIETTFMVPADILSNRISVQANVTHGPNFSADADAVLYVTALIEETGETLTNTVNVRTGLRRQTINLIPLQPFTGLRKHGRHVKITITRKAGTGNDDANTTSVNIHNLNVKTQRASAHTDSSSSKFSPV